MSHWVVKTDDGICVTEAWESTTRFDSFWNGKLTPLATQVFPRTPRLEIFEIHNFLTAG
jgi:hypothetical protein